jgi:ParB family chromosome partitioning protein
MKFDLTGLAEVARQVASGGEPLRVPLNKIKLDPQQPRKHFDEAALQELAASVGVAGVLQPISLRPDPAAPGEYIINYGERRYRAATIAGLAEIPAWVHTKLTGYDQVIENLHRADLSPMEVALFIQERLAAGDKKGDIARRLGKKGSFVTEHLALVEAPACVEQAYANGVTSARTLYELRTLWDEFPAQVDAWAASGAAITRQALAALASAFRHDEKAGDGPPPATVQRAVRHDEKKGGRAPPVAAVASVIVVEHNGRRGTLQPTSMVRIMYDGATEAVEVPLSEVVLRALQ